MLDSFFSHKTGESISEHCVDGEYYSGRTHLPQLVVFKVRQGSMLSLMLLAPGASAGSGQKMITCQELEIQWSVFGATAVRRVERPHCL